MKHFKVENGIVVQVICNPREGFTETNENVVPGMLFDSGVFTTPEPKFTPEELLAKSNAEYRIERDGKVLALTVEVDGMVFDASERSQGRISIRMTSMTDASAKSWKLANNEWAEVTQAQFMKVLVLAAEATTKLWQK